MTPQLSGTRASRGVRTPHKMNARSSPVPTRLALDRRPSCYSRGGFPWARNGPERRQQCDVTWQLRASDAMTRVRVWGVAAALAIAGAAVAAQQPAPAQGGTGAPALVAKPFALDLA